MRISGETPEPTPIPVQDQKPPISYTPKYLTEKILTSRSALEGERKQVTVCFADIKDSTELIKDLDPEDAQKLLDPSIHIMMDAVHRFEGTVNQVLGDGIMALFRVLGPQEVQEDETVAADVPFLVGRDEEVGLLLRRWQQSKEGLGQVVLISSEAGIGKSALVQTLRAHVRDEDLPRIVFRCSPYHRNSPLHPVMTHVEHLLRFERDDPPEVKLDKLERGLETYRLPLQEVVALFAALLSVPVPEGHYAALMLTPEQQKRQTLDALVAWLVEEAERQPVLVAWEDLHWADPSTLEMLGLVIEQTPTVPMLSVLTFRPEFSPAWPARSHMTPITLNRLERPQVEALIMHLADGKALPAEVIAHIVTKTDGVPLFVEELTKMLLESDLLHDKKGTTS
jgi:hypothetical protein